MIPIGMAVSFKAILREGGEAVLLCLTAGEQGEPAAHCIHKDGLGEVEPWQELDLSEAHVLWWCSPKAHCVHPRLSKLDGFAAFSNHVWYLGIVAL